MLVWRRRQQLSRSMSRELDRSIYAAAAGGRLSRDGKGLAKWARRTFGASPSDPAARDRANRASLAKLRNLLPTQVRIH